jgi:hypothetical protein
LEFADASAGDIIRSCGEVNELVGWLLGEGLPAVDLSHRCLAGGEQRPEQHGGGFGAGQDGLSLMRRLNSSCRRSIAFEVRIDSHWLGGKRGKANSLSPAPGLDPGAVGDGAAFHTHVR